MTTPTPNTMDATAPGQPLPGRFRLATTTNPGAVAVIEWFDASDAALTELSGLKSPWPVGRLRHAMLAGIDDGLIGRVSDQLVHLQPHGGPRVVQKLAAWLFERGVTPAPTVPPMLAFPEAQDEHEARRLATLAITDSPAATAYLLPPAPGSGPLPPGRKSLESSPEVGAQAKPLPASMLSLKADLAKGDLDRVLVDAEGNRPDLSAPAIAGLPEAVRPLARLIQAPTVVVAGAPNAGKSTLLNRLVGKTAAVVSDQPGTTRDYVSQAVGLPTDIGELVVRWLDTPGLRTSDDGIEQQAIAIARQVMQDADVLIALREPNTDWPHLPRTPDLWLTTKADTPAPAPGTPGRGGFEASGVEGGAVRHGEAKRLGHAAEAPLAISAQTGQGIAELKQAVAACLGF